jgi:hypothetical protein
MSIAFRHPVFVIFDELVSSEECPLVEVFLMFRQCGFGVEEDLTLPYYKGSLLST